jgi:Platelet-activating factor acetylhydrolase, isoform II
MRSVCLERNGCTRFLARVTVWFAMMYCGVLAWPAYALAQDVLPTALYPVGMTQVEYVDPADGGRPLNYMLIYPAAPDIAATPVKIFLATNLHMYQDAPIAADGLKHPLVIVSHGAGGNGSAYAWFGEYLASHGYIVAMVYHYRANTYDSSALYVRSRLWQRPRDISPADHPSAPARGLGGGTSTPIRLAWRDIRKGLYRAVDRWGRGQSRPVFGVPTQMEREPGGAGVSARPNAP